MATIQRLSSTIRRAAGLAATRQVATQTPWSQDSSRDIIVMENANFSFQFDLYSFSYLALSLAGCFPCGHVGMGCSMLTTSGWGAPVARSLSESWVVPG